MLLEMLDHYSYSNIKTFLDCEIRWKYTYIDKLKAETPRPAIIGKIVHEALASYYLKTISLEEAISLAAKNQNIADISIIQAGKTILQNQQLLKFLQNKKPLFLEKQFEFYYKNRKIIGFIDCILDDGTIIDYKVTNKFYKEAYWLQPLIYLRACAENNLQKNDVFSFVIIPNNPDLSIRTYSISLQKEDYIYMLNSIFDQVFQRMEELDKLGDYQPPKSAKTCQFCPFNSICPSKLEENSS